MNVTYEDQATNSDAENTGTAAGAATDSGGAVGGRVGSARPRPGGEEAGTTAAVEKSGSAPIIEKKPKK